MIQGRRLRLGFVTTAAALAAIGLVAILLSALQRPQWRVRWDWSSTGGAGLSAQAAGALRALPEGSRLTAFLLEDRELLPNGTAVNLRAFSLLDAVVEDARIRSGGKLEVQVIRANSSLVEIEEARDRLRRQSGEILIFEAGGQRQVLRFEELFQVNQASADGTPPQLRRERIDEAITTAANRLAREKLSRVGIVTGYGPDLPAGARPWDALTRMLDSAGFDSVLIEGPGAEESFDLLFIPGQARPFLPADADAARAWLRQGRPFFLAVGCTAAPQVFAFWNEELAPLGFSYSPGLVCQPYRTALGAVTDDPRCAILEIGWERLNGQHPVTQRMAEGKRGTVILSACELKIVPGSNDYLRDWLIRSGEGAWLETDPMPDFHPGSRERQEPRNLLLAAQRLAPESEARSGRAIVFGSAMIPLRPEAFHLIQDWVGAGVRWLVHEENPFGGLSPLESQPLRLEPGARVRLTNLAVAGLPGATLLFGLLVFFRRRR